MPSTANEMSMSDTIVAMDVVDTIRHDERMRDVELGDADRRKAEIQRLREAYSAQGLDVSEDVISKAFDKMDEKRFVHAPLRPGLSKMLAVAYVRRSRYGRNAAVVVAVSACLVGTSLAGRYFLVERPRMEAAKALREQIDNVLPARLKSAITLARGYAAQSGNTDALTAVDASTTVVNAALARDDVASASKGIDVITAIAADLKRNEASAALVKQAVSLKASALDGVNDQAGRDAVSDLVSKVSSDAASGDEASFASDKAKLDELLSYIKTSYTMRIVKRAGVRTGVWRKNDNTGATTWYIVVEAVSPTGSIRSMTIRDRILGTVKTVPYWGIQVPKSTYQDVENDIKSDGVLDNNIAGTKAAGHLSVDWKIAAFDGQMINTW